ncbi:MAG TPA: ATP-binding protein [Polyangiaceae bacterium]|jgi:two-component system phosphate regulon sensor histidine kinase PhoR
MTLTFRAKLLASHLALVTAILLLVVLELNRTLGGDLVRQLDDRLEQQAQGAAQWVGEGRRHPDKLAGRLGLVVHAEVTLFDRDGNVLGDSSLQDVTGAPSGADDPEFQAAQRGEIGRATRAIEGGEMRFVAVPAADGMVVRLGAPLSDIDATVGAMRRRLTFAIGIAIAAALALGWLASRLAARPLRAMTESATRIAQGDYAIVPSTSPDDFGILSRTLASLGAQLEAKLRELTEERDRLSAILAGMAEGVLVVDATGKVVLANPAAEMILGPALVGKGVAEAVTSPALRAVLENAATTGQPHETEVEAGSRAIALYVRPLAARGGGLVTVLRDMTRLRKLLVVRRDFVANVSHELRTPVTAIQGYAETLLRGAVDETTRKQFTEIIHRHARRLGALVEGLLTLSELEARPPEQAVRERVEVPAIAEHVRATLRERAAQRETGVDVDVAADVIARGDPVAVEQVIENLVDNAIKYGKDGGGRVRIVGRRLGDRVRLDVLDDGPGIDAEHLPRLFERFYRVDAGRSRERGGTGLGLAIVKHLVESMGGTVEVDSGTGRGTTFRVEWPAWDATAYPRAS